jgi:hypothetical protein
LSRLGLIALQRALPGSREVIVLKNLEGVEEQATSGPSDLTPSFFPDGQAWMYVKFGEGQLVECSVETKQCKVIFTDPALPSYPVSDPTGRRIAYITSLNASRIRVISRDSM